MGPGGIRCQHSSIRLALPRRLARGAVARLDSSTATGPLDIWKSNNNIRPHCLNPLVRQLKHLMQLMVDVLIPADALRSHLSPELSDAVLTHCLNALKQLNVLRIVVLNVAHDPADLLLIPLTILITQLKIGNRLNVNQSFPSRIWS